MKLKNFKKSRKAAVAALCALSIACTGFAAACAPKEEEKETETSTKREDTQLLKNGNFEFSNVPSKAVHLIKGVDSWSRSGDSSGAMSGIINTADGAWDKLSDFSLRETLDANNALETSNPDYDDLHVDYNGMKSADIVYADPYLASLDADDIGNGDDGLAKDSIIRGGGKQSARSYEQYLGIVEADGKYTFNGTEVYKNPDDNDYYFDVDYVESVRFTTIKNPQTHLGAYDEETGKLGGETVYLDDDGNYFYDEDLTQSVGNVLMVHNYSTNTKYTGIHQYYTSQSISLEANTAAEISLWVKTSNLKFDKGYDQNADQNRGAYIEVTQSVASTSIDSFKIRAINTEKIISEAAAEDISLGENESNGWLKYTVYVNACDFAASNITINLGLGDDEAAQKLTGYAFFDDVEVKKFIDLESEGCSFGEEVKADIEKAPAALCSLTSEKEDKIFDADKLADGNERYSKRFNYLVDLASEEYSATQSSKQTVPFGSLTTSAQLTSEESGSKNYAAAATNEAAIHNFTTNDKDKTYNVPKAMADENGRLTFNDLLGIFDGTKTEFTEADFNVTGSVPFKTSVPADLTKGLFGEDGKAGLTALDKFGAENGDMMLIFSAYGAAYTAKAEGFANVPAKSEDNHYAIVSMWVKTSDLNGGTAATLKLISAADEDNVATLTLDTTGVTTDVGENENIYSDWVQCFFFIENDSDEEQSYKLEFAFGNTAIADSSATSYRYGWAAVANMQILPVNEDVFKLTSTGSYSAKLTFAEDEGEDRDSLDDANEMTDVKTGVATPSAFKGVSGNGNSVSGKAFGDDYDKINNYKGGIAGLINRDYFDEYLADVRSSILASFITGAQNWNEVFGEECYQPLIIVNSLRKYRDKMSATEDTFKNFYIKNADDTYTKVADLPEEEQVFDEKQVYYSEARLAANYGFIGEDTTIDASSYKTVSVRVLVSEGAVAYIYLVDVDTRDVLTLETPEYTFFYDDDGNVLDREYTDELKDSATKHREAVVYTLRDDGLFEDKDGKLFANLYNLEKHYKDYRFEHNDFYKDGEKVNYADLVDGETYYSDAACTKEASHFLVVGNEKIYRYDGDTSTYYYLKTADGEPIEVNNFDSAYARYSSKATGTPEYAVKVEPVIVNGIPQWQTVNFIVHTGNVAKDYRLELWSGSRFEEGADENTDPASITGAVAFDYSFYTDSVTESNFSTVLEEYENAIINVYKKLIRQADVSVDTSDFNTIDDYKAELDRLEISEEQLKTSLTEAGLDPEFAALYYTFTPYDSAAFVPFNKETASAGQTGYNYTVDEFGETLTYFSAHDKDNLTYNTYIDYTAIDHEITVNTDTDDDDHDHDDNDTATPTGDAWLLITSIIFAVVMIFALLAVLLRYILKKHKRVRSQKDMQKNNYKKRERIIRKMNLMRKAPEEAEGELAPNETPETPAESESEQSEAPVDTPAESESEQSEADAETPAETPEEGESEQSETPVETPEEGESGESESKENPDDGENKE